MLPPAPGAPRALTLRVFFSLVFRACCESGGAMARACGSHTWDLHQRHSESTPLSVDGTNGLLNSMRWHIFVSPSFLLRPVALLLA